MADNPKPTKAELAKLPGGEHFDVEGASVEDLELHARTLRARKEIAELTAPATPATFAAPVAPVSAFLNADTGLTVHLPAALQDKLSDEDKAIVTPVVEKPAAPATK